MIDGNKLIEEIDNKVPGLTNLQIMKIADIINDQPQIEKCGDCSRRKFYQQGYQAGLVADKWISCSERLPIEEYENNKKIRGEDAVYPVLITCKIFNYEENKVIDVVKQAWFFDFMGRIDFYDQSLENMEVVAWQPLPDPYNAERGGKNELD